MKSIKNQSYQIVFWQLMMLLGLVVAVFLLRGLENAYSALLGGLAYWLPTLTFVWRVLAKADVKAVKQFVVAFFAGEATKLILSAILFLLIVKYLPVNVLSVLVGYIAAIVSFWIVSIFFLTRNQGASP